MSLLGCSAAGSRDLAAQNVDRIIMRSVANFQHFVSASVCPSRLLSALISFSSFSPLAIFLYNSDPPYFLTHTYLPTDRRIDILVVSLDASEQATDRYPPDRLCASDSSKIVLQARGRDLCQLEYNSNFPETVFMQY